MSDLQRFTEAQRRDFNTALSEIKNGRKQSHWMWYIFPQIHGWDSAACPHIMRSRAWRKRKDFLNDPYLGGNLRRSARLCWNWIRMILIACSAARMI